MTAREAVASAIRQINARQLLLDGDESFRGDDLTEWECRVIADAALAAAHPYIREECAAVADEHDDPPQSEHGQGWRDASQSIAAAIRSLSHE